MDLFRLLYTVSLPRFREHPLRTALTVAGVMLGVATLVAVVLVNRSVVGSVQATFDDISGKADWQVAGGSAGIDESLLETLKATPGVYKATPILQKTVRVSTQGLDPEKRAQLEGQYLLVLGVDFLGEDDEYFRAYGSQEVDAVKEEPLAFLNSSTNIVLSDKFASEYGYQVGDTLPLLTPAGTQDFEVWGFIREEKIGRAFGGFIGVMYYQAAQVAFERGTLVDRFDVAIVPGADADEVRAAMLKQLGPGFEIERPERRSGRVTKMLNAFQFALTMGSMIALLVGMFLIFNTISISVVQRKYEIGILRALGTTRGQILRLFTFEGTVMGIVGSVVGTGLGVLLARILLGSVTQSVGELYLQVEANKVHMDPILMVSGFVLGIGMSLISSLWPAKVATAVRPIETLRASPTPAAYDLTRPIGRSDIIAMVLAAVSIVFLFQDPIGGMPLFAYGAMLTLTLMFALLMPRVVLLVHRMFRPLFARMAGLEAQLANEALLRDLNRASITTAALMIAIGMAVSSAVFITSFRDSTLKWIDQSVPADIFITSAARFSGVKNNPMSADLLPFFAEIEGVESVDMIRIADLNFRDLPIKLLSLDWNVYKQHAQSNYVDGSLQQADPLLTAGTGVLIGENLARRCNLSAGDSLELLTPIGTRTYQVGGVIVDYTSDQGIIVMDRSAYVNTFSDTMVDTYELYLEPTADLETIRSEIIKTYGPTYDLFVLSNAEFKGELKALLDQIFAVLNALELVALIIALLGVINTMLANVLDRVREIGVLRAIGTLRRQVRKMVVFEAMILGFASNLMGIASGLVGGLVMLYSINTVQTGWVFPFSFPTIPIVQVFFLILLVAALAGWYPARQAARFRVTEALGYE